MAQPQAYRADGTPIPVEELGTALASGEAGWEQGSTVRMVDPDGKAWNVPAESVYQATDQGWAIEHPEVVALHEQEAAERAEFGTPEQAWQTVGESAASGLTLGATDWLGAQISSEWAERRKARERQNPRAALAGEIGGALLPLAAAPFTAGASGATALGRVATGIARFTPMGATMRAGRAVEAAAGATRVGQALEAGGTAAKIGGSAMRMAAGGAVEGALYGAGQAVSETALEHEDLLSQKFASNLFEDAGLGAVFGGGAGAVFGAAGRAASEGLAKLRRVPGFEDAARKALDPDLAAYEAIHPKTKAVGRIEKQAKRSRVAEETIERQHGKVLREEGIPDPDVEVMLSRARKAEAKYGQVIGDAAEQLDAGGARFNTRQAMRRIEKEVLDAAEKSGNVAEREGAARARKALTLLAEAEKAAAQDVRVVGGAQIRRQGALSFAKADEVKQSLTAFSRYDATANADALEVVRRVRRAFVDELETQGEKAVMRKPVQFGLDAEGAAAWRGKLREAKDKFGPLREAIENLEQVYRQEKSGWGGRLRTMGAAGLGGLGMAAQSLGDEDKAMGALKTVAGMAGAAVLWRIAKKRGPATLYRLAGALSKSNTKAMEAVDGAVTGKLSRTRALWTGTKAGWKESRALPIFGAAAGIPGSVALPKVAEQKPIRPQKSPLAANFHGHVDAVQQWQADPTKAVEGITAATADLPPELATPVSATIQRAGSFLASKVPQPMTRAATSLTPMAESQRYTRADMAKFERYARAVESPESVIADLADGDLNREGIEALKAVYPLRYEELRKGIMARVAVEGEALPYSRRVLLSLAFDFTGDAALQPPVLRSIQEAHAALQAEAAPPPGPTKQGRDFSTGQWKGAVGSTATDSQRIERGA